ncbi:MAG: GspH/FimT family pseudopilin [Rhodanobacter sp.]
MRGGAWRRGHGQERSHVGGRQGSLPFPVTYPGRQGQGSGRGAGPCRPILLSWKKAMNLSDIPTRRKQAGFTLLELMVTITVAAILTAIAFPNFRDLLKRSAVSGHSNELIGDLNFARETASTEMSFVSICPSANPNAAVPSCAASESFAQGWIVYKAPSAGTNFSSATGFALLRISQSFTNASIIADSSAPITFDQRGGVLIGGTPRAELFFVCAKNAADSIGRSSPRAAGQRVSVLSAGRVSATELPTSSDDSGAELLCKPS